MAFSDYDDVQAERDEAHRVADAAMRRVARDNGEAGIGFGELRNPSEQADVQLWLAAEIRAGRFDRACEVG